MVLRIMLEMFKVFFFTCDVNVTLTWCTAIAYNHSPTRLTLHHIRSGSSFQVHKKTQRF